MILIIFLIDYAIGKYVSKDIYHNIEDIPYKKYAIVLGTAKYYISGSNNLYYSYRIDAAEQLFKNNKTSFLLLSGDNRTRSYNEPITMYKDLIKREIPAKNLFLDYAGFNTLDSIIRANKVFTINDFVIITQKFHCERALLIAKYNNINAICYAAKTPVNSYKVRSREYLARVKVLYDLFISKRQPYFLGNEEKKPSYEEDDLQKQNIDFKL